MIRNGLYNVTGAIIRLLLSLLTIPLLIRLIGIDKYGLWSFTMAVIGIVALSEIGLSLSTTVFVARDLTSGNPQNIIETLTITLSTMLILASLAAISLWLAAVPLSGLIPNISQAQRDEVARTLAIGTPVIWARMLQQVLIGFKQAHQQYAEINILQTFQTAALTLGWLVVAWYGGGIAALMGWQAVIALTFFALHVLFSLRLLQGLSLRPVWRWAKASYIARYSLATWVSVLGTSLFSQFDRLIVGAILGPAALGFYAAVTNVTVQINTLSAMLVQPQFPVITQMLAEKAVDLSPLRERVRQAIAANTAGSLGLGTVFLAGSALILPVLMPNVNIEQLAAFRIVIIIYSLYSINAVGSYILFGADRVPLCSAIIFCCGLAALSLIALGSRSFGIVGAMIGNGGYVGTLIVYWFAMKTLDLPPWAWLTWIVMPVALFLGGSGLMLLASDQTNLVLLIGTVQVCALGGWFAMAQRDIIRHVLHKLFPARL